MFPFLHAVQSIYHAQNKYHNFEHAVDVSQAIHTFLVRAGLVPPVSVLLDDGAAGKGAWKRPLSINRDGQGAQPSWIQSTLSNRDAFALAVAAVGHDVGHPGLSNAFMVSFEYQTSWLVLK